MFKAALLLTAALLTGACTTIGHEKVEGWPDLKVVEHHLPHAEMRDRCTRWGSAPVACAVFDLVAMRCDIYFSKDFPPSTAIRTHERMHCDGFDHEGETHMRDFLAAYRSQ